MKMRSKIIIFLGLTIGLMASAPFMKGKDVICRDQLNSLKSDTSIISRYIKVDSFNLSILPPSSGVQFYKDGIVFLSSTKSAGKMLPEHLSFGKINAYYSVLKDSVLENPEVFSPSSSFPYPCEAITFSSDSNTMYFTKYSKTDGVEKIYKAKFSAESGTKGDWTFDTDPVSFCSGKSTYTDPALSIDGRIMIFSSNRTGSVGGMDLFVSLQKNGTWSDPINLGNAVNSTSNESYPFLDSENNLYFSSDNIQGYGGYDIYVCKFKSNTWEKPVNLSSPVNTRFDDVAFKVNRKDEKSAFYTIKQNSGKRSSQLYRVTMKNNREDTLLTISQFYTRPDISHMVILALEPAVQATDRITESAIPKISRSRGEKDIVIYRVQFLTSFNPRTRSLITVEGKDYNVFEYLYSGAYRLCIGEFSTLTPALELQNLLIKADYRASVVAFKNNVMSLDPELLKDQVVSGSVVKTEQTMITKPVTEVKARPEYVTPEPMKEVKKAETLNKKLIITSPIQVKSNSKMGPEKATSSNTPGKKDIVVYRVQIFSGGTKGGSTKIKINDKIYYTYEYSLNGGYRTCIGEFKTLATAKDFQNVCRKSGYPQAFVVAFKNNVRSLDPALFK